MTSTPLAASTSTPLPPAGTDSACVPMRGRAERDTQHCWRGQFAGKRTHFCSRNVRVTHSAPLPRTSSAFKPPHLPPLVMIALQQTINLRIRAAVGQQWIFHQIVTGADWSRHRGGQPGGALSGGQQRHLCITRTPTTSQPVHSAQDKKGGQAEHPTRMIVSKDRHISRSAITAAVSKELNLTA
jgi:hypothetical protein